MSSPLDAAAPQRPLNLYILRPRGHAAYLVAATSEEHARSFPPFSNWKMLQKFGSWDPKENARAKVRLLGVAAEDVTEGPIMFASS